MCTLTSVRENRECINVSSNSCIPFRMNDMSFELSALSSSCVMNLAARMAMHEKCV